MSPTPHAGRTARHKALAGCGAAVAVLVLGACTGGGSGPGAAQGARASASGPAATSSGGTGRKAIPGTGTFRVGSDVQPGLYRSTGNTREDDCSWQSAKDSSGTPDSVIALEAMIGTAYATIEASDGVFKSDGCKDWQPVEAGATGGAPKTEFSGTAGMLKVGTDIAPGTYTSGGTAPGGLGCYWERTSAVGRSLDAITANGNPEGPVVVTVDAADAYFKTDDCQDWKKV